MSINTASLKVLAQISDLLITLNNENYRQKCTSLNGHTLGQHIRHTLEFFICLEEGYKTGRVNYDDRKHDKMIEEDRLIAISVVNDIIAFLGDTKRDKVLDFEVDYSISSDERILMSSTFFRELSYNIEHAVHHMALLKIGLKELLPALELPQDFGVAVSTIRHKVGEAEIRK